MIDSFIAPDSGLHPREHSLQIDASCL